MPKLLSPFNAHSEFDIVVYDFEVGVLLLTLLCHKREDSPALLPFSTPLGIELRRRSPFPPNNNKILQIEGQRPNYFVPTLVDVQNTPWTRQDVFTTCEEAVHSFSTFSCDIVCFNEKARFLVSKPAVTIQREVDSNTSQSTSRPRHF
jgi:hypothetical protein